jgi:hypothetical protein
MVGTLTRRSLAMLVTLAMVIAVLPLLPNAASAAWGEEGSGEITSSSASISSQTAIACPPGVVPSRGFRDADGAVGAAADCLAWYGITQGTSATTYSPNADVERGQLASFLVRMMREADGFALPSPRVNVFPDVTGGPHKTNIEILAGFQPPIVAGFQDGTFGIFDSVTRGQAAAFLDRTYSAFRQQFPEVPAFPAGSVAQFPDVDSNFVHAGPIGRLTAAGIIFGYTNGNFGPMDTLTRGQMAFLMTRLLDPLVEAGVIARPDATDPDPDPDDETGDIAGTVRDAGTTNPIAGAVVTLRQGATELAARTTNAAGTFGFQELPEGTYTLSATAAGYQTATQNVTVTEGQTASVTLNLTATVVEPTTGDIAGTVVDADGGAPIAGATVTTSPDVGTDTTDAAGAFGFDDVAAGSYTLTVNAEDYEQAQANVTVTAGQTSTVTIELTAEDDGTDPTEPGEGVGNPGPVTVTVTEGEIVVGEGGDALAFPFPECVDGQPEEGFDECVTFSGDVDGDGNLTVPASGVTFPTLLVPLDVSDLLPGLVLDLEVNITAPDGATGQIDPASGLLTWETSLDIEISEEDGLLQAGCGLRGIALSLTTDESGELVGVSYDQTDGTATVVDNQFIVPAATGCGNLFGLVDIDAAVNDALGLPSEPGVASVRMVQEFDPILVEGEGSTDPTEPGDPVGNPGAVTVTVTEGEIVVGEGGDALAFPFPECVDGQPEEGFDECVTFSGNVDREGVLTVPASGVTFPTLLVPLDVSDLLPGLVLDLEVNITAPDGATGQIDPASGLLTWETSLDIEISEEDGLLQAGCGLRGIALSLTTDESGELVGVSYDQTDGTATVVDNQFIVPAATGCGNLFGLVDIDAAVNDALGLPSEPGVASVRMVQEFDPILVEGEGSTDPTEPGDPVGNPGPVTVTVVEGGIAVGEGEDALEFDFPECIDGQPAEGFDSCVVFNADVDDQGNLTATPEGMNFPTLLVPLDVSDLLPGLVLDLEVNITAPDGATGQIDPASGDLTWQTSLDIEISEEDGLLQAGCGLRGIAMELTTDESGALTGVDYDQTDGTATVVDNQFIVPAASGCGNLFGLVDIDEAVNDALGLPSEPGVASVYMVQEFDPILVEGEGTDPTEPGDPVGNPGPVTVTVVEGGIAVGEGEDALEFDFPECIDGQPAEGFDSCVVFNADVDDQGNLTATPEGMNFPTLLVPLDVSDLLPGLVLDLEVNITAPDGATGQIDPASGDLTWQTSLDIEISEEDGLLQAGCGLRGIAMELTTDESGALTGVDYDQTDGTATVVDNQFIVPAASGCGNLFGLVDIDEAVNDALGLPSEPGVASVYMVQEFDPILVEGEATGPGEPQLASIDVMAPVTSTIHSAGLDLASSDGSGELGVNVVLRNENGGVYTVPEGETVEVDWTATAGDGDVALTDLVEAATATVEAGQTATGTIVFAEGTSTYGLLADAIEPTDLELSFEADGLEGDAVTLTWDAPPPGDIEGVVTDGTSEEPLEGVAVTLSQDGEEVATTSTDEDGAYGFDDLVAGTYTADYELDGYDSATETIEVTAGDTTTVDVALLELGAITGTATDGSTFLPVEGADVVITDADGVVAETTTDEDGEFGQVVPAGTYLVTVSTEDFVGGSQEAVVAPGQTVDLDFTLLELATISGQLLDEENGEPVEGATVTVLTANPGHFVAQTTTDEDGRYSLRVPPGSYEIVYDRAGYDPVSRFITVGPGDQASVSPTITPRVEISGRITDSERGLPVDGALVEFISPDPVVGPITIDIQSAALSLPGAAFGGTRQLQNPGTLNAVVNETGSLTIPAGQTVGSWVMNFAHASTPSPTDYDVRMDLNLTGNGTGQIDATTGQVAVSGQFEIRAIQITENFGGTAGGRGAWPLRVGRVVTGAPENCRVQGINIGLTTGQSGPVAGTTIDPFTGEATLAGGQFTVPGFTGCPSFSSPTLNVNTYANGLLGLASNTLGNNRLVLDVQLPVNATQVTTDADGRYAVNVPTGDIFTFITRDGFAPLRDESTVDDGELRDVYVRDYVMTATRSVLTGTATDNYTGAPLEGVTLTARQDDIGLVETVTTGPNGSYTFASLPRGPVDVTAELDGYELFEQTVVLRAAQTELLEVGMEPILSTLDGSILDDVDGQPIADAEVTLTELRQVNGDVTEIVFGTTTSAADGTYRFEGIPQGTYLVTGAGFEYVTTVSDEIVFTPGDQLLQDLRLPPDGVFSGTVTDDATGEPISGAFVTVVETGQEVSTNAAGFYRVTVTGGSYRLEFEAAGYAPAFREVTVANGQELTVNVELDEYTTAGGGTIRDGLTGNRLSGATVRVLDAGGTEVESLTTNNQGQFTLPALPGGSYSLEVARDGYLTRTFPITVVPGQPLTANLALDPVATISGVVTATETGDPIEDASVTVTTTGGDTATTATTEADGTYAAEVAGGTYLVTITADDRDSVQQLVTIARGGSATVDAALTLLPASLTVTTTDAQTEAPIAGVQVVASQGGSSGGHRGDRRQRRRDLRARTGYLRRARDRRQLRRCVRDRRAGPGRGGRAGPDARPRRGLPGRGGHRRGHRGSGLRCDRRPGRRGRGGRGHGDDRRLRPGHADRRRAGQLPARRLGGRLRDRRGHDRPRSG